MRLIDTDAFKKVLLEYEMKHDKRRSFDDYDCGAANAYEHASDLLDEMPTVERPRGKWLISPDKTRACCPFCHNKWTDAKEIALLNTVFRTKNFCEYCGADMRPKEGDGDEKKV